MIWTAVKSAGRAGAVVLGTGSWLLVPLFYGTAQFGKVAFGLAVASLASAVANLGLDSLGYLKAKKSKVAAQLIVGRVVVGALCSIPTYIILHLFKPELGVSASFVAAIIPISSSVGVLEAVAAGRLGPNTIVLTSIVAAFTVSLCRFGLSFAHANLSMLLLSVIVQDSLRAVLLQPYRLGLKYNTFSLREARIVIASASPYYFSSILNSVFHRAVIIIAQLRFGYEGAGLIALHFSFADAISPMGATYAQYAYHSGLIQRGIHSLEMAIKPAAMAIWTTLLVVGPILLYENKIHIYNFSLRGSILIASLGMVFVYFFGACFGLWMATEGRQARLPQYHLASLFGLVLATATLFPFGIIGTALSKPIAAWSGHLIIGLFWKTERDQAKCLLKCLLCPWLLGASYSMVGTNSLLKKT